MFAANAFEHVLDTNVWHFFENLHIELVLPPWLSKYKILMVLAALLILAIFIPLARRVQTGEAPRGVFWNFFEAILSFIRDNIAKPYIGHDEHGHDKDHGHDKSHAPDAHGQPAAHAAAAGAVAHAVAHARGEVSEADRYVPFLWTVFLFVLVCNLLGLVPFMGSPTASISVTGALALLAFLTIHGSAIAKMGFGNYMKALVPPIDLPLGMKIFILIILAPIEFLGHFIKAFVLAVRLFANVFAGHMVLAMLMLFIVAVKDQGPAMFWGVSAVTVLGVVALSLLELFVAFLQAYIFTFLTALFLGAALNPEH